jgi:hypothetical protein
MPAWKATAYREDVLLDQDQIRMQHYCPLHPQVLDAVRLLLGDLRKFAEQYGDTIQWDQSNKAYMTHGVSGIDWKHYKHPLLEHVYDVHMQCWRDVDLQQTCESVSSSDNRTC